MLFFFKKKKRFLIIYLKKIFFILRLKGYIYQPIQRIYKWRMNSNNHKKFQHFQNWFVHPQTQDLLYKFLPLNSHYSHKTLILLAFSITQINFYTQRKSFSHFFHQNLNNKNLKNTPKCCIHKILLLSLL